MPRPWGRHTLPSFMYDIHRLGPNSISSLYKQPQPAKFDWQMSAIFEIKARRTRGDFFLDNFCLAIYEINQKSQR